MTTTTSEIEVPTWYLPSLYGDVRLEADGAETVLYAQRLSPTEEAAMEVLRRRAVARPRKLGPISVGKVPWAEEADFRPIADKSYRETEVKVRLRASIRDVERVLARAMKPGRRTLSAVKFADGRVEEVQSATTTSTALVTKTTASKPSTLALPAKATAAVTVAAPTIGCPAPNFGQADVRARRVLEAFLDPQQLADFRRTGRFVSVGQDTGRRYLLSLRDAPGGLGEYGGRGVYDLDASSSDGYHGGPLCVHDWTVPAAEEVLAIHVCLALPGHEHRMRSLPEILW